MNQFPDIFIIRGLISKLFPWVSNDSKTLVTKLYIEMGGDIYEVSSSGNH